MVCALIPLAGYGLMRSLYFLSVKYQESQPKSTPEKKILIKPRPFIQLAYSYLPLVLGGNLAHYLDLFLQEAGRILPVVFETFGLDGSAMPIFIAHPAVVSFLQATTLFFSIIVTIVLTQKIARQPWRSLISFHMSTLILAISLWKIIID
jgi:hypothetical protein